MKYGDSMAETKRWIIDQIESQSPLAEVICKKMDTVYRRRSGKKNRKIRVVIPC